jgi:hypothetical protein
MHIYALAATRDFFLSAFYSNILHYFSHFSTFCMGRKLNLLPTEGTWIEGVALRVVRRICGMETRPKKTALYGTS